MKMENGHLFIYMYQEMVASVAISTNAKDTSIKNKMLLLYKVNIYINTYVCLVTFTTTC